MISLKNLTVQAGQFRLENVDLEVPTGGYCALMGKTGSGKTTLLEAVCGLKHIEAGTIELSGVDVTNLKPAERNIGYVPQDGALFANMTVFDQIAFALTVRRTSREQIEARVNELAELLEIEHLLKRTIHGLSGGEKQRVAFGRALAFKPPTLCLDEPLSALDDETREQMYLLIEHVREHTGVTTLHVTHSTDEAEHLADIFYRIEDGHIRRRSNGEARPATKSTQPEKKTNPPSPQETASNS